MSNSNGNNFSIFRGLRTKNDSIIFSPIHVSSNRNAESPMHKIPKMKRSIEKNSRNSQPPSPISLKQRKTMLCPDEVKSEIKNLFEISDQRM